MSGTPANEPPPQSVGTTLEYASIFDRHRARSADAAELPVFLAGMLLMGAIGAAIAGVMTVLLVRYWPSFGLTLTAVPVYVIAFGCFFVAYNAGRSMAAGIRRLRS